MYAGHTGEPCKKGQSDRDAVWPGEPSDPDIYNPAYIRIYVGEVYLGGGHVPDANEVKVKV